MAGSLARMPLHVLGVGASSRSSSPARPGSPRIRSPARTPRSMSPQPAPRAALDDYPFDMQLPSRGVSTSGANPMPGSPLSSPRAPRAGSKLCDAYTPASPVSRPSSSLVRTSTPCSPKPCPEAPGILSLLAAATTPCMAAPASAGATAASPSATAPADAHALNAPASPTTVHKHVVKLLARAGGDASRTVLFMQSPLDGIASVVADTASELMLQRVNTTETSKPETQLSLGSDEGCGVSGTAPQDSPLSALINPVSPAAAAPTTEPPMQPPVNPVHANVLSIVVSTLLSGAAHAAVDMAQATPSPDAARGAPTETHRSVPEISPAQRLAMRLSSASIAAALAKAPPLRAADAEDAFGVSVVAATTSMKMLLTPDAVAAPDVGSMLEGILSAVHDTVDGLDLDPTVLLQAPVAGPWAGHAFIDIPKPSI